MNTSPYNIVEKLSEPIEEHDYVILNGLSGSIDLLDEWAYRVLQKPDLYVSDNRFSDIIEHLSSRGYMYRSPDDEDRIVALARAALTAGQEPQPQFVLVTTYNCNLHCPYCFQSISRRGAKGLMSIEIASSALQGVETLSKGISQPDVIVDILGGEPLLPTESSKQLIGYLADECQRRGFRIRITSNGTHLREYCDILRTSSIIFVQVTIDGPESVHNKSRPYTKHNSFKMVLHSIEAALKSSIPVAARTNVSMANISALGDLAELYRRLGFLENPLFYAYLSPIQDNSCISSCGVDRQQDILQAILSNYEGKEKFFDTFGLNNFLAYGYFANALFSQTPSLPRFYRCEANTCSYVFDLFGRIYPCLESAGHYDFSVGTFAPELDFDEAKLQLWRGRNVASIESCNRCPVRFICAGGCEWHSMNRGRGHLMPNCSEDVEQNLRLVLRNLAGRLLKERNDGKEKRALSCVTWTESLTTTK